MKEQKKLFTQQAEELLQILNQQRHDWLNHFQVLLGYLKLGRPEAAEEYVKRVTEEAHQESMIARLQCPPLSVFLLTYNVLGRPLRLEVEVCNEVNLTELGLNENNFYQMIIDVINTIESYVQMNEFECPNLLVSFLTQENQLNVKFDLAGHLSTLGCNEMEKLIERSTSIGTSVLEHVHSEDEWILALSFPCR